MFNKKIIRVEFVDQASGEVIGYDEVAAKKLPEDFQHTVAVKIGGEEFQVLKATPDKRKKYKKTGTIVIEVGPKEKDEMSTSLEEESDPIEDAVVYASTLPTDKVFRSASHSDLFPAFTGSKDGKDLVVMGTWEWRSLEFIGEELKDRIDQEFEQILQIRVEHSRADAGRLVFTKQHRRSGVRNPLGSRTISAKQMLEEQFPFAVQYEGLTFMAADGFADGGFALKTTDGLMVYGLEFGEKVSVLALGKSAYNGEGSAEALSSFMKANQLLLVDWEEGVAIDSLEIKGYLHGNNNTNEQIEVVPMDLTVAHEEE